jgi:LysR family transcriptional regulator, nitrogen assimilation regulatory protein
MPINEFVRGMRGPEFDLLIWFVSNKLYRPKAGKKERNGCVEIKELRYFKAIAELSSFSKAATHLRIAQPALSRQMHKLETDLGVELFLRHARGVTLTLAGQKLLGGAESILGDIRRTRNDVLSCIGFATGDLTISMPAAAGCLLVPPLLARYQECCPSVNVRVLEGCSRYQHEWLVTGHTDIALMHNPLSLSESIKIPLLKEEVFFISPPNNPQMNNITLSKAGELPLILPPRSHALRQLIAEAFCEQGVELNVVLEAEGLSIIKSLVQGGLGYTFLTYADVLHHVNRGELLATSLVKPSITQESFIVMHKDQLRSRAAIQMESLIHEEVGKLVNNGLWRGTVSPR